MKRFISISLFACLLAVGQALFCAEQGQAEQKKIQAQHHTDKEKEAVLAELCKNLKLGWHDKMKWFQENIEKYDLDPNMIKRPDGMSLFETALSSHWILQGPEHYEFAKNLLKRGAVLSPKGYLEFIRSVFRQADGDHIAAIVTLFLECGVDLSKIPLKKIDSLYENYFVLGCNGCITPDAVTTLTHKHPSLLRAYYRTNPSMVKELITRSGAYEGWHSDVSSGSSFVRLAMNRYRSCNKKTICSSESAEVDISRLQLLDFAHTCVGLGYDLKQRDFWFGRLFFWTNLKEGGKRQNILEELQEYIEGTTEYEHSRSPLTKNQEQNDTRAVQIAMVKAAQEREKHRNDYVVPIKNMLTAMNFKNDIADSILDYADAYFAPSIVQELEQSERDQKAFFAESSANCKDFFENNNSHMDQNCEAVEESYNQKLQIVKDAILEEIEVEKKLRREQLPSELFKMIPVSPLDKGPIGVVMEYDDPQADIMPACLVPYLERDNYSYRDANTGLTFDFSKK